MIMLSLHVHNTLLNLNVYVMKIAFNAWDGVDKMCDTSRVFYVKFSRRHASSH